MKVEHILARKGSEVATIAPEATVADLVNMLAQRRIGAVVVSSDGQDVAGIVSERDVVRALGGAGGAVLADPVTTIMTAAVQCAPPSADVRDLMALMTERRFRHIPVVDEDNRMIGIVSIGDIVKRRVDELEGERDALINYVQS